MLKLCIGLASYAGEVAILLIVLCCTISTTVSMLVTNYNVVLLQLIDWATGSSSSKDRLLVFYRLCDR